MFMRARLIDAVPTLVLGGLLLLLANAGYVASHLFEP
jgi:hypothetical protein